MIDRKTAVYTAANVLNCLSLAASVVLLISISIEVIDRQNQVLSPWYRSLQLAVCSIFFVTALFRLTISEYRERHWFRDLLFAAASVPYIDILNWLERMIHNHEVESSSLSPATKKNLGVILSLLFFL